MMNKRVLVFANLKEKKLVGFPSHGMVMCVCNEDRSKVNILEPPKDANIGDVVTINGLDKTEFDGGAKKITSSWDYVSKLLKTNKDGVAQFNGVDLVVGGNTMNSEIKDGNIS